MINLFQILHNPTKKHRDTRDDCRVPVQILTTRSESSNEERDKEAKFQEAENVDVLEKMKTKLKTF